ncbi:HelD family protein [Enterococcus caccae]|uniref:DNA helicase II/ATP-dependent DNA helicase PcrA n=1 Tax=Enterococcus caccae ATCC BAA-1240 TaxID=1158612 RepID=R3WIV4_9ENTE|nr:UvrD-helicase domain-containing protein [Enterococcus caccae]EOL47771.1 DNA helicase II/ATP-dependent DNA helicase PcrA [Enterococcus caccae ATCC BAA-1240]EOT65569.1 DNA helicase II/ATP-dependent DNA helicase PcrA [Enterococcus caccae ATCC BAA-1240]
MSNDRTQETRHLHQVYEELTQAKDTYQTAIDEVNTTGKSVLEQFGGDTKLNFDSYSDNLETFAMMEMKNREIDQLNIQNATAAKQLEKVERLLKVPYFGKIDVTFLDDDSDRDVFYIGMNDFTNLEGESRIYDWRSPIASLFYNNVLGDSSYLVNKTEIPVTLNLKRQLIIEEDRLINFFDTSLAIQDDILLHSLEADSSQYMKDITTTIQQEQNEIIRDERHPLLLVNGIAGSGKTSAIMQRIAYLLYNHRTKITADDILLLSPNSTFIDYISQVLPNLGERNPLNLTLLQFLKFTFREKAPIESESAYFKRITAERVNAQQRVIQSQKFVDFIHSFEDASLIQQSLFKPILFKRKPIFSAELIFNLYQETPTSLSIRDRLSATKEKLSSLWNRYLIKQSKSKQMIDQMQDLTEAEQLRYFDTTFAEEDDEQLAEFALQRLQQKYRKVVDAITDFTWFDQWLLFEALYQNHQQDSYERVTAAYTADEVVMLLLIKDTFIEDLSNRQMAFILVDEVQDYTEAQILLLLKLFPQANFTLAGDENQAIFNTSISFIGLKDLLSASSRSVTSYQLLNSYRSSKEITQLFQTLVTNHEKLNIVSIRKDGEKPMFISCENQEAYLKTLSSLLDSLSSEEATVIITKTEMEAEELEQQLTTKQNTIKAQILSIDMAKGLEFDNVIIHDPSTLRYGTTEREKKILYTAISRGMKQVFLPYIGELSNLLKAK